MAGSVAGAAVYGQQDGHTAQTPKQAEFRGRTLEAYVRMFRRAEEACSEARTLAHRDRDWFDNFNNSQWSDKEKAILDKRGQSPSTSNRLRKKVRFLRGMEQRQRSDPQALPRKPNDTNSATVITDVLDYVEQQTRFDRTASESFKDLVIEGIEACEVIIEKGDVVAVNMLQYDGFFYDPRSKKADFSDAKYLGYQDWFDEDEAIEMAIAMGMSEEDAQKLIEGSFATSDMDEGYDDKPYMMWGDSERKRVRIACMYWKDGKGVWNYVYFTGGGVIKEGPSVYVNDQGEPECAIIAASVYLTRKNERYGALRDDISPQEEINQRKTKTLFLMNNRRMWAKRPGILPPDASEQVAKADCVLIANGEYGKDWGFIDSNAEVSENFQFLQEAKMEIDGHGPNAGLIGRGVEDQSGRAIALQQNAGMAEENDIFDVHEDWKLRVYRSVWFRCKQFKTGEWFIRITEDGEAPRFVGLNTPKPVIGESGQPLIDPATGQPMVQTGPDGQPVLENSVAELDADIIMRPAPESITLQHEEFQQLADLAKAGVPIPPDVLLLASQIRDKYKLAQRIKDETSKEAMLAQAQEQIKQLGVMIQQLQKQLQQAQQQPVQKPLTVVDMAKVDESRAKTDHLRAQTGALIHETMQPPEGPAPMTPVDAAKVDLTRAQADKTRADTIKSVREAVTPPDAPEPPTALDDAKVGLTHAQTAKIMHDIRNPEPETSGKTGRSEVDSGDGKDARTGVIRRPSGKR